MDNFAAKLMILFLGAVMVYDTYADGGFNNRIYKNDVQINRLNFHNHNSGRETTTFPVNRDGELIHTLDGIRGWY